MAGLNWNTCLDSRYRFIIFIGILVPFHEKSLTLLIIKLHATLRVVILAKFNARELPPSAFVSNGKILRPPTAFLLHKLLGP